MRGLGCPHARVNTEVTSVLCFKLTDELLEPIIRALEFAFPNDVTVPPSGPQGLDVSMVSSNILAEFISPEFRPCLGSGSIAALWVSVPKAAVDKNAGLPFWQNNIRPARQIFPVKPEPVAASMKEFADGNLWLRVAASYGTHHSGSRRSINNVHPIPPSGCLIK